MTILDSLKSITMNAEQRQQRDTAAAWEVYREILARDVAGDATPDDAEALAALLPVLGLDARDVESDRDALARVRELERGVLSDGHRARLDQREGDAKAALAAYEAKVMPEWNRLRAEAHAAEGESLNLVYRVAPANNEVRELKQRHPRVFPAGA